MFPRGRGLPHDPLCDACEGTAAVGSTTTAADAAEHVVRMIGHSVQVHMIFEPVHVRASVGDTVRFVPEQEGHHVHSMAVPQRAATWNSQEDEELRVTLTEEGPYLYMCPSHLMMGMVGLVQADAARNDAQVIEAAEDKRSRILSHRERPDALLQRITPSTR